jgi:hypothetical protein
MVTVGLVKELYFITVVFKRPIDCFLGHPDSGDAIHLRIQDGVLEVRYHGMLIWHEGIEDEATSFFGIESCDAISRIIACLNNDDEEGAKRLIYLDNLLDKNTSPA